MKGDKSHKIQLVVVLVFVLLVIGIYFLGGRNSRPPGAADQIVKGGLLSLPVADISLKEGAGQGLVQAYCTTCHSLAPIVRHDGFDKQTWADEVQKMREQYGCPIDDATAAAVTAYLQNQYADTPPGGTVGLRTSVNDGEIKTGTLLPFKNPANDGHRRTLEMIKR